MYSTDKDKLGKKECEFIVHGMTDQMPDCPIK